jgi:uncharacterized protein (DUF2336 family)
MPPGVTIGSMSLSASDPSSFEHLKLLARDENPAIRALVAQDQAAPPELLYYLGDDVDVQVRRTVAENDGAPLQMWPRQARDENELVRAALARKIARVLPRLQDMANARAIVNETLASLCRDQALAVRQAVAVSLQDTSFLPPPLALRLAQESERAVAGPILRFCLSLGEDDLVNLVRRARQEWVPVEVAGRRHVPARLAQAIWESGNSEAASVLLANRGAEVSGLMLEEATTAAEVEVVLQKPLIAHPQLSLAQMTRLAGILDTGLLAALAGRVSTERGEVSLVSGIIRRRLDWAAWRAKGASGAERAKALQVRHELDDAAISDAVAWGERDFIVTALALRAQTDPALVEKVLQHQSPKGITALCWKAGLSMRTCRQVQIRTARIPAAKALNAREGFHYPLPEADLRWQLEFYGII